MVKHIVSWKIKSESKEAGAATVKEKLEALNGQIPGLIKIEVGFDFSKTEASGDIVLYSEFESKEALANYIVHPLHKEAGKFVRAVTSNRNVVDYEI